MSKSRIFYFTGTGNSLFAAKELQKRIPECVIEPMIKSINNGPSVIEEEMIGFVFPIYMMSAPLPLLEIIESIDMTHAKYIFAVATRKGTSHGAFETIEKLLRKKNKKLDASFNLKMCNNSGRFKYIAPTEEEIKQIENDALAELETISTVINSRQNHRVKDVTAERKVPKIFVRLASGMAYVSNSELHANEKCSGCGTCAMVCPSNRIKVNGSAMWDKSKKCYNCAACINYCPVQAVQIKGFTEEGERYSHPYATPADIAAQK